MSYKTELEQNNIDLQSILDTVNALPEADSDIKTIYIGASEPTASLGADGDIYIVRSEST